MSLLHSKQMTRIVKQRQFLKLSQNLNSENEIDNSHFMLPSYDEDDVVIETEPSVEFEQLARGH